PGRHPRRIRARAPRRHRSEEDRGRGRPRAVRARRRRRARRVRGRAAGSADSARRTEPAALPLRPRPPACEVEAARRRPAGTPGAAARAGAADRAGGPGQAGGDPRPRSRGGAAGGRGDAAARGRMTTLAFVEPDDELSLQALTFARGRGEVRAVTIEGAYQPAAWAAALGAAAEGADAIVAAGSDRGNELLAHVAARLDRP